MPSMHLATGFLAELLSHPAQPARTLAVVVAAHVAQQYPMQHTEALVHLALERCLPFDRFL